MAGGLAEMEMYDESAVIKLREISDMLADGIEASIRKYMLPISLAQAGSMMQIHFTESVPKNYEETRNPYKHLAKLFHLKLVLKGIYIAPRGAWALSTVKTNNEVKKAIDTVDETLYDLKPLF